MAGRKHLDVLEERIDHLVAERAPNAVRDAIERMTLGEIKRLTGLYESGGADAFAAALVRHLNASPEQAMRADG
mgnify:CR=1 FL=1